MLCPSPPKCCAISSADAAGRVDALRSANHERVFSCDASSRPSVLSSFFFFSFLVFRRFVSVCLVEFPWTTLSRSRWICALLRLRVGGMFSPPDPTEVSHRS